MDKTVCKKSWSGNHSFDTQTWIIVGEDIKCRFCGLVLDTISLEKYNELKIKNRKSISKIIEEITKND